MKKIYITFFIFLFFSCSIKEEKNAIFIPNYLRYSQAESYILKFIKTYNVNLKNEVIELTIIDTNTFFINVRLTQPTEFSYYTKIGNADVVVLDINKPLVTEYDSNFQKIINKLPKTAMGSVLIWFISREYGLITPEMNICHLETEKYKRVRHYLYKDTAKIENIDKYILENNKKIINLIVKKLNASVMYDCDSIFILEQRSNDTINYWTLISDLYLQKEYDTITINKKIETMATDFDTEQLFYLNHCIYEARNNGAGIMPINKIFSFIVKNDALFIFYQDKYIALFDKKNQKFNDTIVKTTTKYSIKNKYFYNIVFKELPLNIERYSIFIDNDLNIISLKDCDTKLRILSKIHQ
jgi:hypothetical protein